MQKRKTLGELRPFGALLGKTLQEAEAWLEENERANPRIEGLRVDLVRDVSGFAHCDAKLNRLNVIVGAESGVIERLVDIG